MKKILSLFGLLSISNNPQINEIPETYKHILSFTYYHKENLENTDVVVHTSNKEESDECIKRISDILDTLYKDLLDPLKNFIKIDNCLIINKSKLVSVKRLIINEN